MSAPTPTGTDAVGLPGLPGLPGPLVREDWVAGRPGEEGLVLFDASVGARRGAARRIPGARPLSSERPVATGESDAP